MWKPIKDSVFFLGGGGLILTYAEKVFLLLSSWLLFQKLDELVKG